MATNTSKSTGKPRTAQRRRRRGGVSVTAMIALIIIAILMGGVVGFLVSRKTDPTIHALQEANDRIMELENTLTLIGFSEDDDPEAWQYGEDDDGGEDGAADLIGSRPEGDDDVWADNSLISGMLADNGDPVVVAEFDGGQLLSSEFIPEYNDQLTNAVFGGYNTDELGDSLLQSVLSDMVTDKIIAAKAEALGLTQLTAEEQAQIEKEAAESYELQLEDYLSEPEEGAEDDPEARRAAAAQAMETDSGVTLASITAELKQNLWAQKYFDYVVKDVSVSDEEVQTYYNELLEDQKGLFREYPEEFEYAHLVGEAIVFRPEGYRAVRDILIPFESSADAEAASDLMEQLEDGPVEAVQVQLEALFAPLEAKAQEVQEKLNAGQSFDSLMDEYGCSDDLAEEPLRTEGYYVSENSFVNSLEFVQGSLMLDQPGQVSAPLRSMFGIHLVQYVGDVPSGEVPLSEAADAVRAEALAMRQSDYYEAQRDALLEQANVKYYPERLR